MIYDIETSPNLAYVWGKYQQDVIKFDKETELLCLAWKWLGEKETHVAGRDKFTEDILSLQLRNLFDEADIVIAHNGDRFDQRVGQAKMLEFGLDPPSPYKSIDTYRVAKRYFRLNSNKLDDLGEKLNLGRKVQTGGFALWLGCMNNDPKAWAKMKRYNIQDVDLLEKVYLKLRPWIQNHPGLNVIDNRLEACPKCGHDKLESRGTYVTKTNTYRRYACKKCGGWSRSRVADKTLDKVKLVN